MAGAGDQVIVLREVVLCRKRDGLRAELRRLARGLTGRLNRHASGKIRPVWLHCRLDAWHVEQVGRVLMDLSAIENELREIHDQQQRLGYGVRADE